MRARSTSDNTARHDRIGEDMAENKVENRGRRTDKATPQLGPTPQARFLGWSSLLGL